MNVPFDPRKAAVVTVVTASLGYATYKAYGYYKDGKLGSKRKRTSPWDAFDYAKSPTNRKDSVKTDILSEKEEKEPDQETEHENKTRRVDDVTYDFTDGEMLTEIPIGYKVVADDKPSLEEVKEQLEKAISDLGKREEETEPEHVEDEVVETDDDDVEDPWIPQNTIYMTERIRFGEDGIPIFKDQSWESEEGNITLLSQREYLEMFQNHNKEQAVWFSKSGVLVDTSLTPIEVVDTVGPTAFTTLCKDHDLTIFVKNDELETDYELFMNENVTIEEAWGENGAQ